jgi:transposase-like protein
MSYETVRRWLLKFGAGFARRLRRSRQRAAANWHLDEVIVSINGKRLYLWRAVDNEGEILDVLVQSRRNRMVALKPMRKLLKKQGFSPGAVITDKLASFGAALADLDMKSKHLTGGGATFERNIRTYQSGCARDECNASSRPAPPSDFSLPLPPSTTPFASSAI